MGNSLILTTDFRFRLLVLELQRLRWRVVWSPSSRAVSEIAAQIYCLSDPGSRRCREWKTDKLAKEITYLITYVLTPWSRVLLEKLTGSQLVKKFPAFYGTRMFITAFTSARQLSLTWARSIQSIHPPSNFLKIHLNSILSYKLGSSKLALSVSFPHLHTYLPHSDTCSLSHSSRFDYSNNIRWAVQIIKLLII